MQGAWVSSLVWEIRSCKMWQKKKKERKKGGKEWREGGRKEERKECDLFEDTARLSLLLAQRPQYNTPCVVPKTTECHQSSEENDWVQERVMGGWSFY